MKQQLNKWIARTLNFSATIAGTAGASTASAHVKWFVKERSAVAPLRLQDFNHPGFWALFFLSIIALAGLVYLDRKLEVWSGYAKINSYLNQYTSRATVIMRVFTGASLLLAWQVDTMIAPDLHVPSAGWGWYQLALALFLLLRATTPIAGLGMMALYGFAITHFGLFHLLDYFIYFGVGVFLLLSNCRQARIKDLRIPILYSSLGFSLCWVAMEKLFFPTWGLEVISQHPALMMGLDPEFFLLACAFVELCLGYLLIICLLQRPLALTITLVFFTTSAFFGKVEVVGHTLLHGALLVFIVVGQRGAYQPPIAFHKKLSLRMAFAAINFIVLVTILAVAYRWMSSQ